MIMARIRTIKPEFFTSEQIVECSTNARLLFVGIWVFSDDNGIHPASVKRLKMEIFPADSFSEKELKALIDELISANLLTEYEVENKRFWLVTGWGKHQRIDRPTFKHPLPDSKQNSTSTQRLLDERSTTEGNGMEVYMSSNSDIALILNYLNDKTGKSYKPTYKSNTSLVAARLKEGATVEECKAVIDSKVNEWLNDSKMSKYLRPATLFNPTKFAQYVGELAEPAKAQSWE